MSEHARLAPSSAPQWAYCAGFLRASGEVAEKADNTRTREGRAAHWVAAKTLDEFKATGYAPLASKWVGKRGPDGLVVDGEIAEGAQMLVDDVLDVLTRAGEGAVLLVEHRVHMPGVHPTECWGTLDVAVLIPRDVGGRAGWFVFLWDYKHGHRLVEVPDNLQLTLYAEGLRELLQLDGLQDQQTTVFARIVQPYAHHPAGPVREWTFRLSDLRATVNWLRTAAHAALIGDTLTPGAHCRDCPVVGACSAAKRAAYAIADYAGSRYVFDRMTAKQLSAELDLLDQAQELLKGRRDHVAELLRHRLQAGEVGHYVMQQAKGRQVFTTPPEITIAFCKQFGVDAGKLGTITPRQAVMASDKTVRKAFEEALQAITERTAGALTLVRSDQTRAALAFKKED